ncbi:hypothetical protein KSS87_022237 [Heliosperma pusillum]|nr:hypothetical protein KSS87_022237 [Heliosperma pusillum]
MDLTDKPRTTYDTLLVGFLTSFNSSVSRSPFHHQISIGNNLSYSTGRPVFNENLYCMPCISYIEDLLH